MYENLYHKVMNAKSPTGVRKGIDQQSHTQNVYQTGLNQIQDKIDIEYQKQLK